MLLVSIFYNYVFSSTSLRGYLSDNITDLIDTWELIELESNTYNIKGTLPDNSVFYLNYNESGYMIQSDFPLTFMQDEGMITFLSDTNEENVLLFNVSEENSVIDVLLAWKKKDELGTDKLKALFKFFI
jgi:hypothetical protein